MTIEEILTESPDIEAYGGGKWAVYSLRCCWWTSFPQDTGVRAQNNLPCCPHCGSVLLQAPLADFVRAAQENPLHYGPNGLLAFAAAHSRNADTCHRDWLKYLQLR